jgi:hypothetical protein
MKSAFGFVCLLVTGFAETGSKPDCTFRRDPDEYLSRQLRIHREVFDNTAKYAARAAATGRSANVHPSVQPRRNFIDDYIFAQLDARGIMSAPIAGDEEFLRRVSLDLTGRIPAPAEIRAFLADSDEDKRDKVIEKLLASEEFLDKWTMWFGEFRPPAGRPELLPYVASQLPQGR